MLRTIRWIERLLAACLVLSGPVVIIWASGRSGTNTTSAANIGLFGIELIVGVFLAGIILVHTQTGSMECLVVMWISAIVLVVVTGAFIWSFGFLTVGWAYFMSLAASLATIAKVTKLATERAKNPIRAPDVKKLDRLRRRHIQVIGGGELIVSI